MKNDWPHAPVHRLNHAGTYFITGSTLHRQHVYNDPSALDALQALLFAVARKHECALQAWALFTNHYHLIVEGRSVREMLTRFHAEASIAANARDHTPRRKVWFQFWDRELTFEASWLARLRYTQENAVHHGLVRVATDYRWCSALWFERTARAGLVKTVQRMKIDRLKVIDF